MNPSSTAAELIAIARTRLAELEDESDRLRQFIELAGETFNAPVVSVEKPLPTRNSKVEITVRRWVPVAAAAGPSVYYS
jgi:hypothetical protein